jgi:RHS repeat-associated protein
MGHPAGNMTNNGSYVYDAENRLIATSGYSYVYDGDGQRVEKCTEGTTPGTCATGATGTLYWRGAGSDPLTETDLSGNVQNTYIFFGGERVARRDSAGAIHYYFSDHLGSHGLIENATGTACEQDVDYYPYGAEQYDYCTTQVAQNYKFIGKERDVESGLDNFGARYNASGLGRFMTPDWAAKPVTVPYANFGDPQTLNLYVYVENAPLSRIDAVGHAIENAISNTGGGVFGDPDTISATDWTATAADDAAIQDAVAQQQAQNNNQQQQPSPSQASSPHFASISFWPSGAGHLGHIGIGVDTDDTTGFATQTHHSFFGFLLGFFFSGKVQDDIKAHTNPTTGEVASHFDQHIPISAASAAAMQRAIEVRRGNPGSYSLYFRNCAGFVEHVLHAGGVGGVPHSEIFFPPVLYGMLWYVNSWR